MVHGMRRREPESATPWAWFPERGRGASVRVVECARRQAVYIRLTGAASDDAFPSLLLRKAGHKVVRAANFEAEDLLEILALEIYLVPKFCAEIRGMNKWCLFKDLVDLGGQDKTEIVRGIRG
jgi:hypothetical protein